MSYIVTGAAGFIGSHISERLVELGAEVTGVDSFTDYYPRRIKESNLSSLREKKNFRFVEIDLASDDIGGLLRGAKFVFHVAAQPGVRASWGTKFEYYVRDNIVATQRLLEVAKSRDIRRFIFASSSSIYGDSEKLPTPEDAMPKPNSPYGVTKLAGEHLCKVYHRNFSIPIVILRYFSVYGPRQRPDMAFNKFVEGIVRGKRIEVYGDGSQMRDYTYVDDIVSATLLAREAKAGSVYNVGSGRSFSLNEAISIISSLIGRRAKVVRTPFAPGDVKSTSAAGSKIQSELGYRPSVSLKEGLTRQVSWQLKLSKENGG